MGVDPIAIRFSYGPYGKPYLSGAGPYFNISHTRSFLCVAIGGDREIGVDIEEMLENDILGAATAAFGEARAAQLSALTPHDRRVAFYTQWTRTEALVKAMGVGLGAIKATRLNPETGTGWTVRDFFIADGHAAAVAVAGTLQAVSVRDFT